MTTEPTHYGPSPYHPGDTEHRGAREDCPACDHDARRPGRPRTPDGQLTPTELAVVTALAHGGTYQQIGRNLGVAPTAVRATVQRARRRLHADNGAHLVARAIGLRLIPAGIALTPADREVTR